MICPRCNSISIVKNGFKKLENRNVQKYRCNDCNKYFTGEEKFHHLNEKQKQKILKLYKKKATQFSIAKTLGVHLRAVQFFLEKQKSKQEDF